MSMPGVKWKEVKRYLLRNGYTLANNGGDVIVIAPKDGTLRNRSTIRIGHHSCKAEGIQVSPVYIKNIETAFGITRRDLAKA